MRHIFKTVITKALVWEAQLVLRKYKPNIIAVTGSVGKTSTKDAIYAALSEHCFVRKSDKSFNSEIGVPLTVLGCPNAWSNPLRWIANLFDGLLLILFRTKYPDWLVLEVGADRPGDIRKIAKWLPVDIAVITRVPDVPVHVEYFSSSEEVVEEKASIIAALKPSGTLVLAADDARVRALASRAPRSRTITFGLSPEATVCGTESSIAYADETTHPRDLPIGMQARVEVRKEGVTLEHAEVFISGVLGAPAVLPLLAAAAVGFTIGMPLAEVARSFEQYHQPPRGRTRILPGIRGSIIIDDSYNASPAAVAAALDTLSDLRVRDRKIVMLADMMELGKYSVDAHRMIGTQAAAAADMLVTVGIRMRDAALAARGAGMHDDAIIACEDSQQAGEAVLRLVQEGDCVLIKGSQSMRMERAAELLLADPLTAPDVLVRQEREWLKR